MKKTPRPYQVKAEEAVFYEWRKHMRTLLVMATGLGKSLVFSRVAKQRDRVGAKRVLIVAHRKKLVKQAIATLAAEGIFAGCEQAKRTVLPLNDSTPEVVVATVNTIFSRLKAFPPDYFDIVVLDECHRALGAMFSAVRDYFSHAKILGVTATPDRGDGKALIAAFDSVAYQYEILAAIGDGWIPRIRQEYIHVDGINLKRITVRGGDFAPEELSTMMQEAENLHAVAKPTVEKAGDRPTLVFAVDIAHAHALAEVMRVYTDAGVEAIDGTMSDSEQEGVEERFENGETQFIINCDLYVEGADLPKTACVANGRVTRKRGRYVQQIGRGTRVLPGVVDQYANEPAEVRREAIARSAKPDLLVLDFVGNAYDHSLVTVVDALEGKISIEEAKAVAEFIDANPGADVIEALAEARRLLFEAAKQNLRAQVSYTAHEVEPFACFGVVPERDEFGRESTEPQRAVLERMGVKVPEALDRIQASQLITAKIDRHKQGLCTLKQARSLIRAGMDPAVVWEMEMMEANQMLDDLRANRWKRPKSWGPKFRGRNTVADEAGRRS